jgi:hypothetical protein
MIRTLLILAAALASLALPSDAGADPADVDAAARGVVRVVLISRTDDEEFIPVTHGTGFAVAPDRIVTNAHVVSQALQDDTLRIGIVPSEGAEVVFARAVAVDPQRDLALLAIIDSKLRLPPLTIAGGVTGDMSEVAAVGYPMNVDLAQGLEIEDIFRAQPPVKARGFLSGERPSRQFDTILHTAPIARGNSGGPLLDGCGRVLGVNSFGADSDGADAEFYFAVSLRELLPFLRKHGVDPRTNAMPCRSIEELNAAEIELLEQQRAEARERIAARDQELREKRSEAQLEAQIAVMDARENAMALAMVLLLLAIGSGYSALQSAKQGDRRARAVILGLVSSAAIAGVAYVWMTRPSYAEIERRVAAAMDGEDASAARDTEPASTGDGNMLCVFEPARSRVTGARTDDVEFDWSADGCVNARTQYGLNGEEWSRVFVPDTEAAVSVNTYDPATGTFRTDRYLLGQKAMGEARAARGEYAPPACGANRAAEKLGEQQAKVLAILPDRPNERLVYNCEVERK